MIYRITLDVDRNRPLCIIPARAHLFYFAQSEINVTHHIYVTLVVQMFQARSILCDSMSH